MDETHFHPAGLNPEFLDPASVKPFWPEGPGRVDPDELAGSINSLGLLRPPLVWEAGRGWADENDAKPGAGPACLYLLAGSRRLAAIKSLGWTSIPVLRLPPGTPPERALSLGLADNLERGLDAAETALIWHFLWSRNREMANTLAPLLGLDRSPRLRQWSLAAAGLPAKGLAALAAGRLDLETGARLAAWAADDLNQILNLFEALAPSKQKKREWLNWLEDLNRREKLSPGRILASPEIAGALADLERRGRSEVENDLRRRLWRRRHPQLAGLIDQREARLRSLALPPSVRLELDPSLEDLSFTLKLTFSTPADFQRLADLTAALKTNPDFVKILDDTPR